MILASNHPFLASKHPFLASKQLFSGSQNSHSTLTPVILAEIALFDILMVLFRLFQPIYKTIYLGSNLMVLPENTLFIINTEITLSEIPPNACIIGIPFGFRLFLANFPKHVSVLFRT